MLSSIPSMLNSILDKLINEEGDRAAAPTATASAAAAGINACAPPRVRNIHTERETCVEANV